MTATPLDSAARLPLLMLPREHGAWAMLLIPFLSSLLLARKWTWEALPAVIVAVGTFVIREPLVTLYRQKLVWKQPRAETEQARRTLASVVPAILAGAGLLAWRLPVVPLLAMGAAAAGLTAWSVHAAVQKRQFPLPVQAASAAGLNASALLAWLAVGAPWDARIWWLCGLQFAHSGAALLAVNARLQARIAVRTGTGTAQAQPLVPVFLLLLAGVCLVAGRPRLTLALAFSAAVRSVDRAQLRRLEALQTPLRRIGLRELAYSVVFTVLLLAGLR